MTKILFVCHGNICRSPMAEFIMKNLVKRAGLERQFQIDSAATSREELGNPVYPPARRKLQEHGIDCAGKTARQLTGRDYEAYDLLIGMEQSNLRNMRRIFGGVGLSPARLENDCKLHLLLDFTGCPGEIADPWYTSDFDTAWQDIESGCRGLLDYCVKQSR